MRRGQAEVGTANTQPHHRSASGLRHTNKALQLTGWKVERSVHQAVNDTRLEAGVHVTKRDCGVYNTKLVASSSGISN